MKSGRYIAGVIIAIALLGFAIIVSGGGLLNFLDISSLVMVIVPTLALMSAAFGWKKIWKSVSLAFSVNPVEPAEYGKAAVIVGSFRIFLYMSGFIGSIVGVISLLAVKEPLIEPRAGAALVLLTPIYAAVIHWALIEPVRVYLKKQSID
jgi:flagellar motor component MotA